MLQKKSILQSLDWFTVIIYVILLALGWMSVCGASYDVEQGYSIFDFATRSGKQLMWIGTAFLLATVILSIDERVYENLSHVLYGGFMVLLLITPLLARDTKGSLSWIDLGTVKIQPAEFAKFAVALFVARFISTYNLNLSRTSALIRCAAVVFLPIALIILEKETGSALVYFAFFLMFYREGMPGSILFTGFAMVFYFVVGIRYADQPLFSLVESSLGTSIVLATILVFTAALVRVYTPRMAPFYWILGGGLSVSTIALLFALYVIPFDVVIVQVIVSLVVVGYLLYLALRE